LKTASASSLRHEHSLGSVSDIIDRIEAAEAASMMSRACVPSGGGRLALLTVSLLVACGTLLLVMLGSSRAPRAPTVLAQEAVPSLPAAAHANIPPPEPKTPHVFLPLQSASSAPSTPAHDSPTARARGKRKVGVSSAKKPR
jgi:hypothetical protein